MVTFYYTVNSNSLVHHGVKGQHWGERRYQNKDGTWTEEGKARRRAIETQSLSRRLDRARVQSKIDKIDKYRQKQNDWATKARSAKGNTIRKDFYGAMANRYLNKDFKAIRKYKKTFQNYLDKYGYKDLPLSDLNSKNLKMNMYNSLWYS